MTDYRDGKIHGWNGGECPVHPQDEVDLWLRDGFLNGTRVPHGLRWAHIDSDGDIIAFCVTKAYREPVEGWTLSFMVYPTKEGAMEVLSRSVIDARIIRVREVLE